MVLLDSLPARSHRLTPRAEQVLREAVSLAAEEDLWYVGTDHIARALLDHGEGPHVAVLRAAGRPGPGGG